MCDAGVLWKRNSCDGTNGTLPNLTFCTPCDPGRIGGHKPTFVPNPTERKLLIQIVEHIRAEGVAQARVQQQNAIPCGRMPTSCWCSIQTAKGLGMRIHNVEYHRSRPVAPVRGREWLPLGVETASLASGDCTSCLQCEIHSDSTIFFLKSRKLIYGIRLHFRLMRARCSIYTGTPMPREKIYFVCYERSLAASGFHTRRQRSSIEIGFKSYASSYKNTSNWKKRLISH